MSWVRKTDKPWYHRWCINILKAGPIPKHVAFIMDGNRRFAKKNSLERAQGHIMGFDKLAETLEWCSDFGINEVTVYAFSIENFKRSKDEVDGLMELAKQKFERLMEEKDMLCKHGVCIRVLGNLELLPKDLQEMIAEAVNLTKCNSQATLNVCFSYTSRDEICNAMREIADGVQLGFIKESDISEELIDQCLYTNKSPEPDLLVRTSGEVRLSDFLLWQSCFSVLSFVQVLWPDFCLWHLYAAILHYQKNYTAVQKAKERNKRERDRLQRESDYQCVMQDVCNGCHSDSHSTAVKVTKYTKARERRIHAFLTHVNTKRDQYFEGLTQSKKCTGR